MRRAPEIVEFYQSLMKRGAAKQTVARVPKASGGAKDACSDMLREITKSSPHLLAEKPKKKKCCMQSKCKPMLRHKGISSELWPPRSEMQASQILKMLLRLYPASWTKSSPSWLMNELFLSTLTGQRKELMH